jgi:hypothetical protein
MTLRHNHRPHNWCLILLLSVFAIITGCSDDSGESNGTTDTGADVDAERDVIAERDIVDPSDVGRPDVRPDIEEPPDVEEDVDPADVVCRFCTRNEDCEGLGTCLLAEQGSGTFCGYFCNEDPNVCPSGSVCSELTDGSSQCIPEGGFCTNPCIGVTCDEGEVCDPLGDGVCETAFDLCESCSLDVQCGEGNACLRFSDAEGSRNCTRNCAGDSSVCPDGYFCANVTGLEQGPQCVPEILTCTDRCVGVTCEGDNEVCDPLSGFCNETLGLCDSCSTDSECGPGNSCIALPGPDCTTNDDCGRGETCNGGTCLSAHCATDCALNPNICPSDFDCYSLVDGSSVCLPITLTCRDRCATVDCAEGFNCDPQQGACVASTLSACGTPCENSAACGDQDDLCLTVGFSTFCAASCGDSEPCALGYECIRSVGGREHCAPNTVDFTCEPCDGVRCDTATESCNPRTGLCEALPIPCGFDAPDNCPDGTLCNSFEGRCEPIGTACSFENRFSDCDFSIAICTAAASDRTGTCEEDCFSICPAERPACTAYHGTFGRVCMPAGFSGAGTCGELMPNNDPIGRPCNIETDPRDPEQCTSAQADYCLEGVDAAVGGICTRSCASNEDCSSASSCQTLEAGSFCVPNLCSCLWPRELEFGVPDVFGSLMEQSGLSPCALAISLETIRTADSPARTDNAWRTAWWGSYTADPLSMLRLTDEADIMVASDDVIERARRALLLARKAAGLTASAPRVEEAPADTDPLFTALQALAEVAGDDAASEDEATAAALDSNLQIALATLIVQLRPVAASQDRTYSILDEDLTDWTTLAPLWAAGDTSLSVLDDRLVAATMDLTRRGLMYQAASRVIDAVGNMDPDAEFVAPESIVRFTTPYGPIGVGTAGNDEWDGDEEWLLILDPAGNDTYTGAIAANTGVEQPFAIVIDLSGDDTYTYDAVADPTARADLPLADAAGRGTAVRGGDGAVSLSMVAKQGAGLFGVGALFDFGQGTDTYSSLRFSQGFGLLGTGILVDDGNAEVVAEAYSQGAGLFGFGILVLGDTANTLQLASAGAGWGAAGGVGVVIGGTAGDSYNVTTDPELEVVYSDLPARRGRVHAAAFGAGVGRLAGDGPADTPWERTIAGGVGVFIELGGDDTYDSGSGAFGYAYESGVGVFVDRSGADEYTTTDHTIGAALNSGRAIFADIVGNDIYNAAGEAAGFGNNFATSIVLDAAGNDEWTVTNGGLGLAQYNSLVLFFEQDGNDSYTTASANSYGRAALTILGRDPITNPRRAVPTISLFADADGLDEYTGPDLIGAGIADGADWRLVPFEEAALLVFGFGRDENGQLVVLHDGPRGIAD